MRSDVRVDQSLCRVMVRADGQWTLDLAERWYADIARIHDWTERTGARISILADLDGLVLHTQEVSRRMEQSILLMQQFRIERYALIVPSFLMRMQCRRLLAALPHSYFDTVDAAKRWLGWEPSYRIAA